MKVYRVIFDGTTFLHKEDAEKYIDGEGWEIEEIEVHEGDTKYQYHYCATYQNSDLKTFYCDGIIEARSIITREYYAELRTEILPDKENFTILSLSLLGEK